MIPNTEIDMKRIVAGILGILSGFLITTREFIYEQNFFSVDLSNFGFIPFIFEYFIVLTALSMIFSFLYYGVMYIVYEELIKQIIMLVKKKKGEYK